MADGSSLPEDGKTIPWRDPTASYRLPPRLCVLNARDALDRAYGIPDRAAVPLLIEAVDWLRRAMEQMAPEGTDGQ